MEPEPWYGKVSSRVKQLLELEPIRCANNESEIHLVCEFTSNTSRNEENDMAEYFIEDGLVTTKSSFGELFIQSTMSARWFPGEIPESEGYYAQSDVTLSFQPTRQVLFPTNPHRGSLYVVGTHGSYKISPNAVRVGTLREDRNIGSVLQSSVAPDGRAEWDFQADNQDLRGIRSSFRKTFGSNEVRVSLGVTKMSSANILSEEIIGILDETRGNRIGLQPAFSLTSREQQGVDSARKQLLARASETSLFALQCGSATLRLPKSSLSSQSPAFATCFQNVESQEVQNNCYTIRDSTPEAVENFIIYCEHFLVPDMDKHAVELAKLAHVYQMESLLKLCELYLVDEVSRFVASGMENLSVTFPKFLEICTVASLLELPVLLVQLHFVIVVLDEKVVHFVTEFSQWQQFLKTAPDFAVKRMEAIANMKKEQG